MIYEDEDIDLTQIKFNMRHEFYNCTFQKQILSNSSLIDSLFDECIFETCDLSNCTLTYSTFNECTFKDCKLIGINWTSTTRVDDLRFEHCNLSYNVFLGLELKSFQFIDCLLEECDFSESVLDRSSFHQSNLKRAIFNNTSLKDCDLTEAIYYSINPLNNQLKGATFNSADALTLLSFFGIKLK